MRRYSATAVLLLLSVGIARADTAVPPSPHETPVTAWLRDGRVFTGLVDSRTDEAHLWLRTEAERIVVAASYPWKHVERVRVMDEFFTGVNFHSVVAHFASRAPDVWPAHGPRGTLTIHAPAMSSSPTGTRVAFLVVNAQVANWDADAESDGIALRLLPQSLDGHVLPVSGSLIVELCGRNQRPGRNGFPTLGGWSQAVRPTDFTGPTGALYRLPFTQIPPDVDLSVLSIGMVQVRLHAPGQGHFDATAPIRVRSYNPLRDQLLEQGNHHDAFGRYRSRHW